MPISLNGDSFDWEKRGRIVDRDALYHSLGSRAADILRMPRSAASKGATGWASGGGSREAVLKVIAWSKSGFAAPTQARYIARARSADAPEGLLALEDEQGNRILGQEAIAAALASWELSPDSANRSPAWKKATPAERTAMAQKDALQRRQTAHLIFSVPAGSANRDQLNNAVRSALSATLGANNYPYLFTVHDDHSARPHVHILVRARSTPIAAGGRSHALRLGPSELDYLRKTFVEHAQAHGISVQATRRADRPELREKIRNGQAPLRKRRKKTEIERAAASTAARATPPDSLTLVRSPQVQDEAAASSEVANSDATMTTAESVWNEVIARASTATDADLAAQIAKETPDTQLQDQILDSIIRRPDIVYVGEDSAGAHHFTTRARVEAERQLLATSEEMAGRALLGVAGEDADRHLAAFAARFQAEHGFALAAEQLEAARGLTTGNDYAVMTGYAGTGKSTTLAAAKAVWEAEGLKVYGGALAGIAAKNLLEIGLQAHTLHAWEHALKPEETLQALVKQGRVTEDLQKAMLASLDQWATKARETSDLAAIPRIQLYREEVASLSEGREASISTRKWAATWAERQLARVPQLDAQSVLVIDEAGMVGTEQLARLTAAAGARGAKVVLVGDEGQLQPIEHGAPFRLLRQRLGDTRITEVFRQRSEWMRDATRRFADGDPEATRAAVLDYDSHGAVKAGIATPNMVTPALLRQAETNRPPLTAEEKAALTTATEYVVARARAGLHWRQADEPMASSEFYDAQQKRSTTARQIVAQPETYKPWLALLGVQPEALAADALVALGETRAEAHEKAEAYTRELNLDYKPAKYDDRLRLDWRAQARSELLDSWTADRRTNPDKSRLMLAYSRADASALNLEARNRLRASGLLREDQLTLTTEDGPLALAAGDRIMFREGRQAYGVRNGTLGTIEDIDLDNGEAPILTVVLDDGATTRIDTSNYTALTHGYAVTTHKSQGVTVDQTYVLASTNMDRFSAYVAMSRHRDNTYLFGAEIDGLSAAHLAERLSQGTGAIAIADLADPRELPETPPDNAALVYIKDPATQERLWPERPISDDRPVEQNLRTVERVLGRTLTEQEEERVTRVTHYLNAKSTAVQIAAEIKADGAPFNQHRDIEVFRAAANARNFLARDIAADYTEHRQMLGILKVNRTGLATDALSADHKTSRMDAKARGPLHARNLEQASRAILGRETSPRTSSQLRSPTGDAKTALQKPPQGQRVPQIQTPPFVRSIAQDASPFQDQAPAWYSHHGAAYERRRLDALLPKSGVQQGPSSAKPAPAEPTPAPTSFKPRSPAEERAATRLDLFFGQSHKSPTEARDRFLALYMEAPKLALWAANSHPIAFGEPTNEQPSRRMTAHGLKSFLSDRPRLSPATDAGAAARRLEAKELRESYDQGRTERQPAKDREDMARSLKRFADRLERDGSDARAPDQAIEIRNVAAGSRTPSEDKAPMPAPQQGRAVKKPAPRPSIEPDQ